MAESTQSKRQREEEEEDYNEYEENVNKRHKSSSPSYNQILSILEEEEDESNQDYMLDIFQSLQQELSSDSAAVDPLQISSASSVAEADHQSGGSAVSVSCSPCSKEDDDQEEDDDSVRMMRHLLEASDDELGLPNRSESGDEEINSGDKHLFLGDGLWEFEDVAANYYTLLQSELFM